MAVNADDEEAAGKNTVGLINRGVAGMLDNFGLW